MGLKMDKLTIDAIYVGEKSYGREGSYHRPLLEQWQVGETYTYLPIRKLGPIQDTGVAFCFGEYITGKYPVARCDIIDLAMIGDGLIMRRKSSDGVGMMADLEEMRDAECGVSLGYDLKIYEYGDKHGVRRIGYCKGLTSNEAYAIAYEVLMGQDLPRPEWEALHALSFTG